MPGMKAPAYMSPTDLPSWSAMMISTSEGGMICASVPDAAITPRCETPVVAVAQHDRQRDQPHRDDRRGDDAGGRRQQRADEDHRVGEPAAHGTEHLADRVEQVLGHAAALEYQPHEGEERHGKQRVVGHDAPDPLGQRLHERRVQQSELDADQRVSDADGGERKGTG